MKMTVPPDILEATRLTRQGRLAEATSFIRRMLRGGEGPGVSDDATLGETGSVELNLDAGPTGSTSTGSLMPALELPRRPGAEVGWLGAMILSTPRTVPSPTEADPDEVARHGRLLIATYSTKLGSRDYKLYVPGGYKGQPLPLVVMLHGCTQSADDFAAGTRMNAMGEERNFFVAYPVQPSSANGQRCWNWFSPANQRRGLGEPALIAGITRQISADYAIDPNRIYVAGLSAGGAAAAIMGATYPDLYAAIGVHSGLACGAASDLTSALSVMSRGGAKSSRHSVRSTWFHGQDRLVPTIVFHGDHDRTVHPRNGDHVIDQFGSTAAGKLRAVTEPGHVPGGRTYSRTSYSDVTGKVVFENWVVHGAGHAWSGGSPTGTFTDPRGPDASREMIRFFYEHPHPAPKPI